MKFSWVLKNNWIFLNVSTTLCYNNNDGCNQTAQRMPPMGLLQMQGLRSQLKKFRQKKILSSVLSGVIFVFQKKEELDYRSGNSVNFELLKCESKSGNFFQQCTLKHFWTSVFDIQTELLLTQFCQFNCFTIDLSWSIRVLFFPCSIVFLMSLKSGCDWSKSRQISTKFDNRESKWKTFGKGLRESRKLFQLFNDLEREN